MPITQAEPVWVTVQKPIEPVRATLSTAAKVQVAGEVATALSYRTVAGVLEALGGVLLILGLFTRPVAFLLCGEMAVAYFGTHFPRGFAPIQNGGELAVLYCFVFLYLAAAGGGPIGLDRAARRK